MLHRVVRQAAALAPLAEGLAPHPVPGHGLLVYGLVPLAFLSASALFLAPGLFLALALGRGERVGGWLLSGLALSLVTVSLVAGVATRLAGAPVTGVAFGLLCLGLAVACAGLLHWKLQRGLPPWPFSRANGRFLLALSVLLPLGLLLTLAPKFLWESFNGDGAHAFESSRLLLRHALPFWPPGAGDVAHFPGVNSMLFAFPNGWYLRLFGEVDPAVRLPFLLYLGVLAGAVLAVGDTAERPASRGLILVVWTSLLAFALAMMFSASYDPYSADVALPAAQDTLLMVCFLGWVHSFLVRSWRWLILFTVLSYTASPSGLLLMGFWLLAIPLVVRPHPWAAFGRTAAALFGCLLAGALLPALLGALGLPRPGEEHGPLGLLRYFAYLQVSDWKRLALVVVPCGILPIASLFLWRRQDEGTRLLTLVTLGYFLFFFFLAHVSLHHFVPVMVLPVAVAARVWPGPERRARAWRVAWQGTAAIAVLLSLPRSFALADARRRVGATISESVGDYAHSDPAVLHASTLLHAAFPYDGEASVPDTSYGGSPLAWNRYALHGAMSDSTNYVLQRAERPAPAGMRLLAADGDAALYIRSDSVWQSQLALRPPTSVGSPVYSIPRGILFHRPFPLAGGPRIIDVQASLKRAGIDLAPLLARLGVRR
ncbi:MAG TPA: hypothetical protein VL241_12615 [Gemmatimonadales bacterium]|nr:hypothetical protein [Gemmatimonadales bacterium]